jgi:hypothetical protein
VAFYGGGGLAGGGIPKQAFEGGGELAGGGVPEPHDVVGATVEDLASGRDPGDHL